MTQRHKSAHQDLNKSTRPNRYGKLLHIYASTLPAQSFFLLSSVSFLSGGLAIAQTETGIDNIVPTVESSPPPVVIPTEVKKETVSAVPSPPESDVADRKPDLTERLRSRQAISTPETNVTLEKPKTEVNPPKVNVTLEKPKTEVTLPPTNVTLEKPKTEVAAPTKPQTLPEKLPEIAQPANTSNGSASPTAGTTRDFKNSYIDPTNYNTNTTATYQAPNSVVLTERSSGCQTVVSSGQSVSGNSCVQTPQKPANNQRVANSDGNTAPSWLQKASENTPVANVAVAQPVANNTPAPAPVARPVATNNNGWTPSRTASTPANAGNKTASRALRFIPNPSDFAQTSAKVSPSGETLPPPMTAANAAPRPSTVAYDFPLASVLPQIPFTGNLAYRGDGGMIFPLSIPARITSVFGWRNHPITGDRRFHAGTDLGAPMGTPVLAAATGQVETAGWLGGYGLTVTINHPSAEQSLYAHLSELYVQPGQRVEQGTVIGRVGSTGNSTGPHLHFEVRHLKPEGWVAVDSGVQLQVALNQLIQALQTARVSSQPES
jgi:murein DD-endopeptidase MepM/ murein hydrolase activator NlpD